MKAFLKQDLNYHKDQIESYVSSKLSIFGGSFLVPILFFIIFKNDISLHILIPWLMMHILIFIFRFKWAKDLLKQLPHIDRKTANNRLKKHLFVILLYSFLWGAISYFVITSASEIDNYIYFIALMGMTTAAMTTLGNIFHALVIYVLSIMIPVALSYLVYGTKYEHYLLVFFSILYVIFILLVGFKSSKIGDELYKQQEELKTKNKNFTNLLNITMEAIVVSDQEFKILDINQAGVELFNAKDKEDAIGRSMIDFVVVEYLPTMQQTIQNEIQKPYEMKLKKIGGEEFPVFISSRNITIDGKQVRVATILDLTQLKEKEQQLLEQSRLAQMGEMIGMIAHQWRQPLTAISASANTLSLDIMMDNYDKEFFEEQVNHIAEYSQHLSSTIDDFRNFFKNNKEKQTFTLEEVVDNTLSIIDATLKSKSIQLKKDFSANKEIESYPNELKQVVLNLIKNAEDILLEKEIENPWIKVKTFLEDNKVVLTVADNAGGVPLDIIDKIFDPYFSTKLEKDGTGLGLYMSKTIIEEHCKGKLSVTNSEFGAVFKVILEIDNE